MSKLALLAVMGVLYSCGKSSGDFLISVEDINYSAAEIQTLNQDTLSEEDQHIYHNIGHLFLMEHYSAKDLDGVHDAIRSNPPGGIVFWNPDGYNAFQINDTLRAYSATAIAANQQPLLFSEDYEGGALRRNTGGGSSSGIQKFTQGFTKLPHPRWLGEAYEFGRPEACDLFGKIMGKELEASGLNYPLSTVADLARPNPRTGAEYYRWDLFANRAISTDSSVVEDCLSRLVKGFIEGSAGHAVFVTKHFPGLGNTKGDTHNVLVRSARVGEEFENALKPFRGTVNSINSDGSGLNLSVMVGHAQFDEYEKKPATESKVILSYILKGFLPHVRSRDNYVEFVNPIRLKGISLSDAMWMGLYGALHFSAVAGDTTVAEQIGETAKEDLINYLVENNIIDEAKKYSLSRASYQEIYNGFCLNSTLQGMDMLMVPKRQFAKLVNFYRRVYFDKEVTDLEKHTIEKRSGLPYQEARTKFMERVKISMQVIADTRSKLRHPEDLNRAPKDMTIDDRNQLYDILTEINSAWEQDKAMISAR